MLEKDNSPQSIRVRYTGYISLFFSLGFIISLIVTIALGQPNEEGETVYPTLGLTFNFVFAMGAIISLILFLIFYFYRFAKRANGPALAQKPKEEFKDEYKPGSLIDEIKIDKIDYFSFFLISFHTFMKDIIVLSLTTILSLVLALYLYFRQVQINLSYALFVLFAVSLLILCYLLFLMPISERKKYSALMPKEIIIYQNKLAYKTKDVLQEYTFSICHKSYITKNSVIFIYYRDGEKRFVFMKNNISSATYNFLLLKARQVKNNN